MIVYQQESLRKIPTYLVWLSNDALAISEWFPNNPMKLNKDKCHLIIFGGKSNEVSVKIGEANAKESKEEKLLGIVSYQTLSFIQHARKPVKNFMPLLAGPDLDCRTGRTCDSQHSAAQQYF